MLSMAVVILLIALVFGTSVYAMYLLELIASEANARGSARLLVKEGQSIAFAIQLAEQDLIADNKPVRLSVQDLVPAYLPMIPVGHANLVANPLGEGASTEFDFSANRRVFTSGAKVSKEMCRLINEDAGFRANQTAAYDSDDNLIVSLSADYGKRTYGCETASNVVFYGF